MFFPKFHIWKAARVLKIKDRGVAKDRSGIPWPHSSIAYSDGRHHPRKVIFCDSLLRKGVSENFIYLWCWECLQIIHKQTKNPSPEIEVEESQPKNKPQDDKKFLKNLGIRPD